MLKRSVMLFAGACSLAFGARAQDDGRGDGIRAPLRLTVGTADQLLGQFASDDRTLYFVSNAEASSSIYQTEDETIKLTPAATGSLYRHRRWYRLCPSLYH